MLDPIHAILNSPDYKKWVFLGDSITHAPFSTHGHRDYTEIFKEFITYDCDRRTDLVINAAIGGNCIDDILGYFDWRIAPLKPDVVFVMIGMNDCSSQEPASAFEDKLRCLSRKIADLDAIPVLQTTCPIISQIAENRVAQFEHYMNAIRVVSKELGLLLIDHTRYWKQYEAAHPNMMNDGIHPNHFGHRLFARLIFEALGIYTPASDVTSMYIPRNIKWVGLEREKAQEVVGVAP